ncbi:MAG TPA: T9SS type A sorting domain-containing protein [Candidatus Marinimicrobia bacterium]|nr:T9SS type A sorting domain-containing protein [Candidatus Neomarinimicrobiota bacterium]
MDQPGGITIAYDSWYDLQAADAVHKVGHVRLMVQWNEDGSLLLVEATGTGWRVRYHSFTLSELSAYTPRYYVNMEGAPGNYVQPTISFLGASENDGFQLFWNPIESDDLAGMRLFRLHGEEWIPHSGGLLPLYPNQAQLTIESAYRLRTVSATDTTVLSLVSDAYSFAGDSPQVLIVDGFDRYGGAGSWDLPYHDFAYSLGKVLKTLGLSYATAANEAIESGQLKLNKYNAVFWFLGDESTQHETFNDIEQERVKEYLKQGGKLFVSGSEIAWDLDNKGSNSDKSFIHNYLKVGYGEDDSGSHTVLGEAGTPFADLSFAFDDGSGGIYEEDYPDVFTLKNGSSVLLRYGNQKIAAVGFQGNFTGRSSGAVVTMGFPLETILEEDARIKLIAAILSFFNMDYNDLDELFTPKQFLLSPAYPNPFNQHISFKLYSAVSAPLLLTMVNLKGQIVYEREWQFKHLGEQTISVDFPQLSSGVYFYQLRQNQQMVAGKITLLK